MESVGILGTVYLIHFNQPYLHAKCGGHSVSERFERHKQSRGSKLLAHLNKLGIDYFIVRTWEFQDRYFERKLKKRKNSSKLCPVCRGGQ